MKFKLPKKASSRTGNVAVFLTASALVSTWFWGAPAGALANLEFREPIQAPEINASTALDVETYVELEAWAKDNVRVKPAAIQLVSTAIDAISAESTRPKVVYGKEWKIGRGREIFSAAEFTDVCRAETEISKMRETLELLRSTAAAAGKEVIFVVAPSKYRVLGREVLGERYDELAVCAEANYLIIEQLRAEFPGLIKLVSPKRVMFYAPESPYWVGDTHWTPLAARALSEIVLQKTANLKISQANAFLESRLYLSGEKEMGGLFRLSGNRLTTAEPLLKPFSSYQIAMKTNPAWNKMTFEWTSPSPVSGADASMTILHDSFVLVPRVTSQFGSAVARGVDVHWQNFQDLAKVPVTDTLVIESVDRTFLAHLLSATTTEDLTTQKDSMRYVIDYLARIQ